ncbi:MAG TPA: YARHG domain-containing protein [Candidatus Dojkabacteria bacterium]|jgi:hypothetical protein
MKYIFAFSLLISLSSSGQSILLKDFDSLDYYYVAGKDTLSQIRMEHFRPRKTFERDRLLYINNKLIDSTGIYFSRPLMYTMDKFYGYSFNHQTKISSIYEIYLNGNIRVLINHPSFRPFDFLYSGNNNGKVNGEILYFNLAENNIVIFNDVKDYFLEYPGGLGDDIWRIKTLYESVICEICPWNGGCTNYRYLLVSRNRISEIKFDYLRLPNVSHFSDEYELFRVNFYFSHYDYDFLMAAVDYGNLLENTDLIFSKDLEDTTHILKKHKDWKIVGENIQEGHNEFFYIRSILDNKEKVIVNYIMNKDFEKITYQLFKGHAVTKRELNNFNSDQLNILKNLIFAKYNYAFESEFYQAFFNLFAFYNQPEKLATRTKDVNNKLTKPDMENLSNINSQIKGK